VYNSNREKASRRTPITLALDDRILTEIKQSAQQSGESINSKVNNILTKYAYFDRYTEQESALNLPGKDIVTTVLDNIEENKLIEEYKTIILDAIPSDLLQKKVNLNLENCIKYVFDGECIQGGSYQKFSYYRDNDGYLSLEFKHIYPTKWSRIIGAAFVYLIETFLGYRSTLIILSDGLVLKIADKNIRLPGEL
jgi:hypothetical protein